MLTRACTEPDVPLVLDLAVSSGLFPPDGIGLLEHLMVDYFGRTRALGHACVLTSGGEGVAYYEPAPATDGTWYLTMIAVRRDAQGQGVGTALMAHVETALRDAGQRVLLVQTSGDPAFVRTRAFYARCGYDAEARVRDYYAAGEDMVLFRKALPPA